MKGLLRSSFIAMGMLWLARAALGASVSLAWDASPGTNVIAHYNVYWGRATRTYTNAVNVGTNLTATITNLIAGPTYHFAATATDASGLESDYSDEVTWTWLPPTNVVTVTLAVETNSWPTGAWSDWCTLPVTTITNPLAPIYYRSRLAVTTTNASFRVLRLDTSTLLFTNR